MINILKFLAKSNRVTVYCPQYINRNIQKLPFDCISSLNIKNFNFPLTNARRIYNDFRVYRFLKNEYKSGSFDVLQVENSLGALTLMSKSSFPKVGIFHGRALKEISYSIRNQILLGKVKSCLALHFLKLYLNLSEKMLARKSNRVIVTSELVKEYAIELGSDANKIFVASNGVDLKEYAKFSHSVSKYELRKKIGIPQDAFVFVFHGSLEFDQNIEAIKNIIKIRNDLKNSKLDGKNRYFLIVGGPVERIKTLWKENRTKIDNVLFTGYVEDVKPYLFSADCGIAPYPEHIEPGGPRIKILEFLAARLPVITTKKGISGIEELIYDQPIYLINENQHLKKLSLEQKVNIRKLEKFDWSKIAASNEKILKETIKN